MLSPYYLRPVSSDVAAKVFLAGLVVAAYALLFVAAQTGSQPQWNVLISRYFVKHGVRLPGSLSYACSRAEVYRPYFATATAEASGECQIDVASLHVLLHLLGVAAPLAETRLLFATLDITANGWVSYGEALLDYPRALNATATADDYQQNYAKYRVPFATGTGALETYMARWRVARNIYYHTAVDVVGRGLSRDRLDYSRFVT